MKKPILLAVDFESVLVPELWPRIADATSTSALRRTTRDIPDVALLMKERFELMNRHQITMARVLEILKDVEPLPGAAEFAAWAQSKFQMVIISDTFYEFAHTLLVKLGSPMIFCHSLIVNDDGLPTAWNPRMCGDKKNAVAAFRDIVDFTIIAIGDSYNDIGMLRAADHGILFNASDTIAAEFPDIPRASTFDELTERIERIASVS